MYYDHFGLAQPPFRITPNTDFFYSGGNRGPILEALVYAIGQGEGIIKVTGEVGSGKTMLCNMLPARLPPHVETVYIANPGVTPVEILRAIAFELHLEPPRDAGHLELMQTLHQHLLDRHAQHKQVVVFVEESQSMPIATLEEIRLLSNLETARSKLLQIVLFGQPELDDNLRQPNIRQLRERITHSFRLGPFSDSEVREYLEFRLRAAGYRGPDLFSSAVIKEIARASAGLTRRINLVADKALLAAFSENTHTVRLKHVRAAIRDSEFGQAQSTHASRRLAVGIALFALGAGAGIAIYALLQQHAPATSPAALESTAASSPSAAANETATTPAAVDSPLLPAQASDIPSPAASPSATLESGLATLPESREPPQAPPKIDESLANETKVSNNSHKTTLGGEALEIRLAATKTWLTQQEGTAYSIQLLGADNTQQLKRHLNNISKYVEINEVFVYRTIAKQKPSLTVLYGTYADRRAAQEALANLPASLKAHKPILRTVQGIRAEIARNQSS